MEEKEISITLKGAAWNVVMNALAGRPYAEVVTLVAEIQRQAAEQVNEQPAPSAD